MLNEEFLKTIVASILSGISIGGIIVYWFKKRINFTIDEKIKRIQNQKDAMNKFLETWHTRRHSSTAEWKNALREIMLWCPNDALYHIGQYLRLYGKPEADIQFGKAILCFRKTLGYKNRWWRLKKVSANQIILFYSAGDSSVLK